MTRNLKLLGPALLAVSLLSAMTATGASALEEFHTSSGHTFLTGEAKGPQIFEATPTKGVERFECQNASLDTNTSTIGPEITDTQEITAGPTYSSCKTNFEGSELLAQVKMGKCHYLLDSRTEENEHADLELKCAEESESINLTVTGLQLQCLNIPQQVIEDAVHYTSGEVEGKDDITVEATAGGIELTTKGGCVKESPEPVTHNNGVYTGNITVSGHNTVEEKVDVRWSLS
jgi:hypothetical protein